MKTKLLLSIYGVVISAMTISNASCAASPSDYDADLEAALAASLKVEEKFKTLSLGVRPPEGTSARIWNFFDGKNKQEAHKFLNPTKVRGAGERGPSYTSTDSYHFTVEQFTPEEGSLRQEDVDSLQNLATIFKWNRADTEKAYQGDFYDLQLWCHFKDASGQKSHYHYSANSHAGALPIESINERHPDGIQYASFALMYQTKEREFETQWTDIIRENSELLNSLPPLLQMGMVDHGAFKGHLTVANFSPKADGKMYSSEILRKVYQYYYNQIGPLLGTLKMDIDKLDVQTILAFDDGAGRIVHRPSVVSEAVQLGM